MKKPFKVVIATLIALVLGSIIGIGFAILGLEMASNSLSVNNGPWQTNLATGSEQADMYTRAFIAVHWLLALRPSENIYYTANTDDSGQTLGGNYVYRIEGKTLDARWWSITVYGADDFLIPNELNRYSYNANNIIYDSNGRYCIYVSKTQKPGAWLPLGDQSKFVLALRLYNPGSSLRNNPATVELPHIVREGSK